MSDDMVPRQDLDIAHVELDRLQDRLDRLQDRFEEDGRDLRQRTQWINDLENENQILRTARDNLHALYNRAQDDASKEAELRVALGLKVTALQERLEAVTAERDAARAVLALPSSAEKAEAALRKIARHWSRHDECLSDTDCAREQASIARNALSCPNCGCEISDHSHGGIGICSWHGCEDVRSEREKMDDDAVRR